MTRLTDAAERVEAFLRQRVEHEENPEFIFVEGSRLLVDDVALLVECAHWLVMASNGGLRLQFAEVTQLPAHDDDARMISSNREEVDAAVADWNENVVPLEREPRPAFVAKRLVGEWMRA
ncbi:hypothetical protein SEA_EASTWEST_65 [Arthrobacter phage EastWest]|uniref:Uncharacterized protein n=1 Tax=Arthrobacter phage EastWest TaxID=2894292 RepID=A0AAE8YKB4_9CAUD|nr:hypothetical protein SEA_EASTWEST_65 [Arthrobacter phage EastWest]